MKILVTGAKGFIGKNLCESLKNIRDLKDQSRDNLVITDIFEYDRDSDPDELTKYCAEADFVFNLAGVNRPQSNEEYRMGNFGFASHLLNCLESASNTCPVMLSSSIQASLTGRFADSEYGKSKLAGEELFFDYSKKTGALVHVFRFPNVVGKWSKPNYNSAVATFCHNIANDLEITVNDRSTELNIVFVEDVVDCLIDLLSSRDHRCDFTGGSCIPNDLGKYCYVPTSYHVTLGEVVDKLYVYNDQSKTHTMPEMASGSLDKKLFAMFLSYLPESKVVYELNTISDERGSFTEVIKSLGFGQFSINIAKPGVVKGNHWHHIKWELFIVVSGEALIEQRKVGTNDVYRYYVSGTKLQAVYLLPGYTHNLINLSDTEDLITLMWANEPFSRERPDTFHEVV